MIYHILPWIWINCYVNGKDNMYKDDFKYSNYEFGHENSLGYQINQNKSPVSRCHKNKNCQWQQLLVTVSTRNWRKMCNIYLCSKHVWNTIDCFVQVVGCNGANRGVCHLEHCGWIRKKHVCLLKNNNKLNQLISDTNIVKHIILRNIIRSEHLYE